MRMLLAFKPADTPASRKRCNKPSYISLLVSTSRLRMLYCTDFSATTFALCCCSSKADRSSFSRSTAAR
jgi:hypothetical protein